MKKKVIGAFVISLSIITGLTCLYMIVPAKDWVENEGIEVEENVTTKMTYNNEIQSMVVSNGTKREDWNLTSETDSEIVLKKYIGESTDVIIPGELDGKQVCIMEPDHNLIVNQVESIKFQEVNGKKVKVKSDSLSKMFYNSTSLVSFDGSGLDITGIKDMSHMFQSCSNLTKLVGVETWDTSTVTNMANMFDSCSNLTSLTGLETWNTSSVVDMSNMFDHCFSLTSLVPLTNWNVSSVTNMMNMFYDCKSLTSLMGLESWNVSLVQNMASMFSYCNELMDITAIEHWDSSSLTDISAMFERCSNLVFFNFSNWNFDKVTNRTWTFHLADKTTAPILVISSNNRIKNYNYANDNRTPIGPTFDAGGGKFLDDTTIKAGNTTYVLENTTTAVDTFLNHTIDAMEIPTREGYEFLGWKSNLDQQATVYDRMNATYIAKWKSTTLEKYTITFDSVGGSFVDNQIIEVGSKVRKPSNPVKEGYVFAGWYEQTSNTPFDFASLISANKTLIAKWDIIPYTILYELDGGINNSENPTVYSIESKDIKLNIPSKEGYRFIGWTYEHEGKMTYVPNVKGIIPSTSVGDWNVIAHWIKEPVKKYTVNFINSDGSKVENQIVEEGMTASDPIVPTRDGYYFVGWYSDPELVTEYDFHTPITSDITLYACWKEEIYSITYQMNDGINDSLNPMTYQINNLDIHFIVPKKDGYEFIGWTYIHDDDIHMIPNMTFYIPSGSTGNWLVFANWKENPKIEVSFESSGGSKVESQNIILGATATKPKDPIKKGYTFVGWYEEGANEAFNFITPIHTSKTLKAKWNATSYAIEYKLDGASNSSNNPMTYTIESGDIKLTRPNKEGYDFVGWTYQHGNVTTTSPKVEAIILNGSTGNWVFSAHFKKIVNSYHVTFDSLDGSKIDDQTIEEGNTVSKPSVPTKVGYSFKGWYKDKACMNEYDFDTPVTNDMTLYAGWREEIYPITYQINDGMNHITNPTTYKINTSTIHFVEPVKENYTFIGWTYIHGNDIKMTPSMTFSIPTGSIGEYVVFANWKENPKMEVTFDSNGGSAVESQMIENGMTATKPNDPSKVGYTFVDWYEQTSSTPFDFTSPISTNKTLEAKWEVVPYTIYYDLDGGINVSNNPNNYTIEDKEIKLHAPSKPGYTFEGWTYQHGGEMSSIPNVEAIIPSGSVGNWNFIAHWKIEEAKDNIPSYQVNFHTDDGSYVGSQIVKEKENVIRPINPVKEGYEFDNWYEEKSSVPYDFTSPVTSNKELFAKYKEIAYNITYILDDATIRFANPTSYMINTPTFSIEQPIRPGYVFIGWTFVHERKASETPRLDVTIDQGTTGDWVLIANWKEVEVGKCVVNFHSHGGNVVPSQSIEVGKGVNKPNIPVKEGYTFVDWYQDENYTEEFDFTTAIMESKTLHAKWQKNDEGVILTPAHSSNPIKENQTNQAMIEKEVNAVKINTSDTTNTLPNVIMLLGSIVGMIGMKKRKIKNNHSRWTL